MFATTRDMKVFVLVLAVSACLFGGAAVAGDPATPAEKDGPAVCQSIQIDSTPDSVRTLLKDATLVPIGATEVRYVRHGARITKISTRLFEPEDPRIMQSTGTIKTSCTASCTGNGCSVRGCDPDGFGCSACYCDMCGAACTCTKKSEQAAASATAID
jgi:hypothetical protein